MYKVFTDRGVFFCQYTDAVEFFASLRQKGVRVKKTIYTPSAKGLKLNDDQELDVRARARVKKLEIRVA